MPNRSIVENVLIAQEIVKDYHKESKIKVLNQGKS